jgi:hypothetical protein
VPERQQHLIEAVNAGLEQNASLHGKRFRGGDSNRMQYPWQLRPERRKVAVEGA